MAVGQSPNWGYSAKRKKKQRNNYSDIAVIGRQVAKKHVFPGVNE
jgi:hypothetical protein